MWNGIIWLQFSPHCHPNFPLTYFSPSCWTMVGFLFFSSKASCFFVRFNDVCFSSTRLLSFLISSPRLLCMARTFTHLKIRSAITGLRGVDRVWQPGWERPAGGFCGRARDTSGWWHRWAWSGAQTKQQSNKQSRWGSMVLGKTHIMKTGQPFYEERLGRMVPSSFWMRPGHPATKHWHVHVFQSPKELAEQSQQTLHMKTDWYTQSPSFCLCSASHSICLCVALLCLSQSVSVTLIVCVVSL